MVFQDISELNDITKKMGFLASHDSLTRLPNRRYLQEYLHALCTDYLKLKSQFAVLFLDLDSFKIINDTLGHAKMMNCFIL
ncbi:diguanylate cyclase domain-containing protein [Pseudoalteromonas sp. GB43]